MDDRRPDACEYTVPSLTRRLIAETVDGAILFLTKAAILLSVRRLDGTAFGPLPLLHLGETKGAARFSRRCVNEETGEGLEVMMAAALVYRFLGFFYETVCVGAAGGATPGKFLLGLRVVTCDACAFVAPGRVRVRPASRVSMAASAKRALLKRVCLDSVFNFCVALMFRKRDRTAYDILTGTIVVKGQR